MHSRPGFSSGLTAIAAAVLLVGCAVGPDFKVPAEPGTDAKGYTATPVSALTASAPVVGGATQRFVASESVPPQWWALFRSPQLDQLIRTGLRNSPSLAAAQDALRQAEENYRVESGQLLAPAVNGQTTAQRSRAADQTAPGTKTSNLFNASLHISYSLDLSGGNRRELEGVAAKIDYQRFEVEATYQTLVANIVTTAIREASLRAQLQATRDVLALQTKQLSVVEAQRVAGAIAPAAVLQQRTQVAETEATIPPLAKSLAFARHQLAVYVGQSPGADGLPEFDLDSLKLPDALPLTLPSALVRQRPDIRASEALLHVASAQVGVATAALYPQINLSASLGSEAFKPGGLFGAGGGFRNIAAGVTQPIFNGGALRAEKRSSEAAYEQARAQYEETVLVAFQNVADVLRSIEFDAEALQRLVDADGLAHQSLDLSTRQYGLGAVSYLALLDVQRTYQQTRLALVQAQAARFADTAALFQALGGGWWNSSADQSKEPS